MSDPHPDLVLLLEAPLEEAKHLRDVFEAERLGVTLVRPESCGKKA